MSFLIPLIKRRRTSGIFLGITFALLLAAGWIFWPQSFFRGYWFALMFWAQLSLGSLIVLLLQQLTGGEWGRVAAPFLRASASGFLILIPCFIPPLLSLSQIFPWTKIEAGISSQVLVNKEAWLNPTAFMMRSFFYLGAFGILILFWRRLPAPNAAGPILVVTILLISFCSADWMMSLQPTFYSSLYPFLYFSGAMVSTFALLSGIIAALQIKGLMPFNSNLLLAYGKLLFAAVLFWGYIVFCQFIIIWTGNLPDEAEWYVIRSEPSWLWFTLLVLAGHFVVPFCILLSQQVKKHPRPLLAVSTGLLSLHLLEVFWMMRPTPGEAFQISVFDFVLPVLFGAGWLWFVLNPREVSGWIEMAGKENGESHVL